MDEVVKAFLLESHENLQQVEQELMRLEEHPDDRELLASVFRTIHTIKGTCGFLGFQRLEALSHAGENLLSALRDGTIVLTREIADELLRLVDGVRKILAVIERTGAEGDEDFLAIALRLTQLRDAQLQGVSGAAGDETDAPLAAEGTHKKKPLTADAEAAPAEVAETHPSGSKGVAATAATIIEQAAIEQPATSLVESTVRVDVRLLDRMMDLVGELVLARNQLLQMMVPSEEPGHVGAYRRVDRVTNDLQMEVMKTRMQPIDVVFQMLPRLMRDLAGAFGKRAHLDLIGGDTELDRTMLEAVRDPLVHLLRNALDHGIESPRDRRRLGKPIEGRVVVRSYHQGGQVTVEVSDDGAGIDLNRLRRRSVELGHMTEDEADKLSDADAMSLIFQRGFSTASEVTNYSGRGVGMDVVRVNIERVGGTVEVSSEMGFGTTTRLRIPLTLAIIPALTVVEGGRRYAIPQVNVQELVRVETGGERPGIEDFNGIPVFRLRGRLLPVVFLGDELWGQPTEFELGNGLIWDDSRQILILQADDRLFGLVVESIEGTQEIVVKPLNAPVSGIPILAGATILGDGSVALILDAVGLAQRAGVVAESRQRAQIGQRQDDVVAATTGQQLLLMCAPGGSQAVLPVDSVVRLEQIAASAIEHLGGQEVVQHRGEILPLVRIIEGQWEDVQAGVMAAREHDGETLSVIVFIYRGRRFGLIVEDVVDIIDETQALQEVGCREGVLGSMIVRGHVAELLDIEGLVFAAQRAAAERERLALKAIEEGAAVEPTTAASAGETGTAAVEDSAGEHANAVTERPRKRRSARKASASSAARRVVEPADGDPVEG